MSRAMRRWLRSWMRGRRCRSRGNLQGIRLGLIQAEACEPQGFNSIYLLPVVFGLSPIRFSFRRVGALAATGPATRWIAKAMPKARPKVQSNSVGFGLRAPGVGRRPSAQARRFYEPQKHSQQLGLARRENRFRFSRPKNSRSPKHSPVLRPVSASLRLRCRSAAFAVARWDFISILLTAKRVKSPFRRAGDGFLHEIVFFAHSSFFARLRDSSIFGSRRNS